jgi:hypothetical protein
MAVRHADAGVADLTGEQAWVWLAGRSRLGLRRQGDDNLTLGGEFNGIAQEIPEDLAEAGEVADDGRGQAGFDVQDQLHLLVQQARHTQIQGLFDADA